MSEENIGALKIYADKECTKPISTIEWNNSVIITLANGTKQKIPNSVLGDENAIATVWIRNEGPYDFGITKISFPDKRVNVSLSSDWIYPHQSILMTLTFVVHKNPTREDIVKAGKINIEGYYICK